MPYDWDGIEKKGKLGKISDFFEDYGFNIFLGVLGVATILGGYHTILTLKEEKFDNKLYIQQEQLDNVISTKTKLINFKSSSATLSFDEINDQYTINIFGSHETDSVKEIRTFTNAEFSISKENYDAIREAVKERNKFQKANTIISSSNSVFTDVSTYGPLEITPAKLNQSFEISSNIYNVLQTAVENAYQYNITNICNTKGMVNTLKAIYKNTNKNVNKDNKFSTEYQSEFQNKGIILTSISDIVRDKENDLSVFHIITMQHQGNNVYREVVALVKVQGADLESKDVYGKFLDGDIYSFQGDLSANTHEEAAVFEQ